MTFVLFLLREHRAIVALAALVGLAGGGANAKLVAMVNGNLTAMAAGGVGSPWFYLGVTAMAFAAGLLSELILVFLSEQITYRLRINMCAQIMRLPVAEVEKVGRSRLTATFTQDIQTVTTALLRIPTLFVNAAVTVGCLVYLGFLSPVMLAVLFGFLVLSLASYLVPERWAIRKMEVYRHEYDRMICQFDAMSQGAKELKLHHARRRAFFEEVLCETAGRVRSAAHGHRVVYAVLTHWSQMLFFLFVAILIYLMPRYEALDAKVITGFALVMLYLVAPLDQLMMSLPRFRAADVAFVKVRQLGLEMDATRHGVSLLEPGSAEPDRGGLPPLREIRLRGLTHVYYREREERQFVMGPIDLTIRAGELVFITGGNGSGKTTLGKLIAGLYVPAGGDLLLNGEPVTDRDRERFRQYFSAIFSDFHVFEQILGLPVAELDSRALSYLEKLELDHKVEVVHGALSTTSLSSGQRKRLALLVAYLEDRPVYLFDEWASDQDPEFKHVFYRHLLPELKAKGKTVIAISHDDRYFDVADRVLKLADGRLQADPARQPVVGSDGDDARRGREGVSDARGREERSEEWP
ncbi:cyclic peptide export ABC transporter [Sorangium sp. So ce321]|uniref:cyclic peptide export ABC transporter n=1 Tax=Sorangium sp. So ce321 TaxID=3133300 RepID=UPI003F632CBB